MSKYWGDHTLILSFAGFTFELIGLSDRQLAEVRKRYAAFLITPSKSLEEDRISIRVIQTGPIPELELSENNQPLDISPLQLEHTASGINIKSYGFIGAIHLQSSISGWLGIADESYLSRIIVIENYLRILCAYAAVASGGLMLHSSAVVWEGRTRLFVGCSGAGKTTLARLSQANGEIILSDDANIIKPSANGSFYAYPVPFMGDLTGNMGNRPDSSPVSGLFWLSKSSQLSVESIQGALRQARLLACCPFVNTDRWRLSRLLEVIDKLMKAVSMRVLHFNEQENFESVKVLI